LGFAAGHNLGREKPVNADLLPVFLDLEIVRHGVVPHRRGTTRQNNSDKAAAASRTANQVTRRKESM
jgi:hypothetical protein